MEDHGIIQLYWQRDQQAIAASEESYGPLCRSLSYNILSSHEDAEECTNDTWYKAWNTMPPQRPRSLRAYFCRIVRNLSIDRWREKQSRKRGSGMELLLEELGDCLPGAPSAESQVEGLEVARALETWLDGLPKEDRVIFLRRYWMGIRVDELAKWQGWTPNRMSQRLLKLRKQLRKRLEQEGVWI